MLRAVRCRAPSALFFDWISHPHPGDGVCPCKRGKIKSRSPLLFIFSFPRCRLIGIIRQVGRVVASPDSRVSRQLDIFPAPVPERLFTDPQRTKSPPLWRCCVASLALRFTSNAWNSRKSFNDIPRRRGGEAAGRCKSFPRMNYTLVTVAAVSVIFLFLSLYTSCRFHLTSHITTRSELARYFMSRGSVHERFTIPVSCRACIADDAISHPIAALPASPRDARSLIYRENSREFLSARLSPRDERELRILRNEHINNRRAAERGYAREIEKSESRSFLLRVGCT